MKALTFHGRESIHCETVADPTILDPGDVVVDVELTAICGSDLHVYHEREVGLDRGTVMGHEFVGRVSEVGRDVTAHKSGDRVFSPFTTSCGRCFYCSRGLSARCDSGQLYGWVQEGVGLHGGQAERVRVPLADSTLVAIPEGVTDEEALLLADVFPTGYFCARNADVRPDGVYVVVGCGPVGLMSILGLRELGAERILALDSVEDRLSQARLFGASPLDVSKLDAVEAVREATDGRGADAVLELVGSPTAGRSAYDLVRPGGTVSVVGVHNEANFSFSPAEAYDKNLTFRVGRCPVRGLLDELIPVVQRKKYDLASVFSHRLPLEDGVRGYRIFDKKLEGCTKVVLTI